MIEKWGYKDAEKEFANKQHTFDKGLLNTPKVTDKIIFKIMDPQLNNRFRI